jgi:pimeloyl-ACP methyl ester carboxylesterase
VCIAKFAVSLAFKVCVLLVPCFQVVPSVDEMAAASRAMMRAHGLSHACVIGHSYGSAVASRLLQDYGLNVDSLVLIDPVSGGRRSLQAWMDQSVPLLELPDLPLCVVIWSIMCS